MYYYTCKAVLTHILHKFYQTRLSINVNGFPPNSITFTCIVKVKLNKILMFQAFIGQWHLTLLKYIHFQCI